MRVNLFLSGDHKLANVVQNAFRFGGVTIYGGVAGKNWMKKAEDRALWRAIGKIYLQQWTDRLMMMQCSAKKLLSVRIYGFRRLGAIFKQISRYNTV